MRSAGETRVPAEETTGSPAPPEPGTGVHPFGGLVDRGSASAKWSTRFRPLRLERQGELQIVIAPTKFHADRIRAEFEQLLREIVGRDRGAAVSRASAIAKVHVAKKQLGLDDEAYRAVLRRVTGRDSAADPQRGSARERHPRICPARLDGRRRPPNRPHLDRPPDPRPLARCLSREVGGVAAFDDPAASSVWPRTPYPKPDMLSVAHALRRWSKP